MDEIEKPERLRSRGGCWFQAGLRQLHVGVEEPFHPAGKAHPAFSVRDIDALWAVLQAAGVSARGMKRWRADGALCSRSLGQPHGVHGVNTLIVTGGSRGIGASTARLAGARGYAVCVNYLQDADAAASVVRDIESRGGKAIAIQADIGSEADVVALFEQTTDGWAHLRRWLTTQPRWNARCASKTWTRPACSGSSPSM